MPKSLPSTAAPLRASLFVYNLLLPPGLLLALPGFLLKMKRRGGYGHGFGQRFASYSDEFPAAPSVRSKRPVWVHAVSVGEVLIAQKLIAECRRQSPELPFVLSTTTSTGHALAVQNRSSGIQVVYNPVDLPWIVRRSLKRIRPRAIVLIEAEVWPNLLNAAVRENIPVMLTNARLSPRTEKRYKKFRRWVAPIFRLLNRVCVQEREDIDRWTNLGVARERISHTGSIKFDQYNQTSDDAKEQVKAFREILKSLWNDPSAPMVLLASSHEGEEAGIGKQILTLHQKFPSLKFLVAPRHFERASSVERELRDIGLSPVRRSQLVQEGNSGNSDTLIIDSTGELRAWQALPDLVIIGKSFLATGGQNPVEAISAGTPVITGPHMENFKALMALLKKRDGIAQVDHLNDLPSAVHGLLTDGKRSAQLVENARRAIDEHRKATQKTAQLIVAETTSQ